MARREDRELVNAREDEPLELVDPVLLRGVDLEG